MAALPRGFPLDPGGRIAGVTPEMAVAAAARPVGELDRAWTTDPRTLRRARTLELTAWAFYVGGRGGVVGADVHPDLLVAAFGTIAPDALRAGWDATARVGAPTVAGAWLDECAAWGEDRLAAVSDARLVDLLDRVVGEADATALPVFAAARTMVTALVDGCPAPAARVALLVHALHEYRSGALVLACRVAGLSPVEALIAGPEGEQEALTAGWTPPFPARLAVLRRYAYAGSVADRLTAPAFAALSPPERAELVDRLKVAAAAVTVS